MPLTVSGLRPNLAVSKPCRVKNWETFVKSPSVAVAMPVTVSINCGKYFRAKLTAGIAALVYSCVISTMALSILRCASSILVCKSSGTPVRGFQCRQLSRKGVFFIFLGDQFLFVDERVNGKVFRCEVGAEGFKPIRRLELNGINGFRFVQRGHRGGAQAGFGLIQHFRRGFDVDESEFGPHLVIEPADDQVGEQCLQLSFPDGSFRREPARIIFEILFVS